jgi:hypothetical protein
MDFSTPFEREPVRFSSLEKIAQSPAHYQVAARQTATMRKGSYSHALLLGTSDHWAIYDGVRRGKEWESFKADHDGKEILSRSESSDAIALAEAVERHRDAMALLREGEQEKRLEWEFLGRNCAGTPDVRHADRIVDLKTTRCSEPGRFVRDATFRLYHAQLAWYLDGVTLSGVGTPREAWIVAVESTPPYPVTVLKLTDNALNAGRRACRLWMERLLACEAADSWPGYCEAAVDFDVAEDVELSFGGEE